MEGNILPSANSVIVAAKRTNNLSNVERQKIAEIILQHSVNGKSARGTINSTATKFFVSRQTISTIWRIAFAQVKNGGPLDVRGKKKGNCGRKPIHVDLSGLSNIALCRRTNFKSMAVELHCSKSTVHILFKLGLIKAHTSAVKPFLTTVNITRMLEFCLTQIKSFSPNLFESNYQTIHIDEKWFYMTKPSNKYYMDPTEPDPYRACKGKGFITKVMFMGAVARPRMGVDNTFSFDGKIGIFSLVVEEPTKRKSKNRPAGVMETKAELSITKSVIKACLIDKLLPAIKAKWPEGASRTIIVQQDNARPHLDPNDPEWCATAMEGGWDIRVKCQPANSPYLNVLDLGFFRAIQSLQHQNSPKSVIDLVDDVVKAYANLKTKSLNFVWLSLQQCMIEITKVKRMNGYKLPHMNKNQVMREGLLSETLKISDQLLQEVRESLEGDGASTSATHEDQFMDENDDHVQP